MKMKNSAWKFVKPNEMMFVFAGGFFLLVIITAVSMYRNSAPYQSQVNYENLPPEQKKRVDDVLKNVPVGDDDKNVRYAERVREASSIGLGLSLFLVSERVSGNRVLTLPDAMNGFSRSALLPPGVIVLLPEKAVSYGLLRTERGIYYINYSPRPLKIEILAGSFSSLADGAVFVLRVPDTSAARLKPDVASPKISAAGAWATIFEAPETENHYIPPPFSPAQTYLAMDWKMRPLQQAEMSPQRVEQLNQFLQNQN